LKPRHREFRRCLALPAGDFDGYEIVQIDIQQCVTHSLDPFIEE
jgi:hypothetical protein